MFFSDKLNEILKIKKFYFVDIITEKCIKTMVAEAVFAVAEQNVNRSVQRKSEMQTAVGVKAGKFRIN